MIIRTTVTIQPGAMALADLFGYPSFKEWGEDLASRAFAAINAIIDENNKKSRRPFVTDLEVAASGVLTREESSSVTMTARFVTSTHMEIHVDAKDSTQEFSPEEGGWIIH